MMPVFRPDERLGKLLEDVHRLRGRIDAAREEKSRILHAVGVARARVAKKDEVEAVLEALERRFHEKSMGVLESLLTAFLSDVLPREGGKQRVEMQMSTQRGLPALQVQINNGGESEDALRGRGGSVANVLSAGLRFIAVARSSGMAGTRMGMRPFLVLDEADCWLSPERVADFARVIDQLSRDLHLQVLVISHHDSRLFHGFPVHLERVESTDPESGDPYPSVRVRYVPDRMERHASGWEHDGNGKEYPPLKSITLKNFLSHKDTVIPLSPGVTVLTGDNDVGKSAVAEAFRAVAYDVSSDALIRHGADRAEVTIDLLDGTAVQWVRVRKGNPKVLYRWLRNGEVEQETPAGRDMPEWVSLRLGIGLRDDLDVQIGDQKSPVFLLNETPAKRAAILDIGQESQYLRTLRDRWKKQLDEDRKTIRDGENRLRIVERILEQEGAMNSLLTTTESLQSAATPLARRLADVESDAGRLDRAQATSQRMQVWRAHPVGVPECPDRTAALGRIADADRLLPKIATLQARLHAQRSLPDSAAIPDLRPMQVRIEALAESVRIGRNLHGFRLRVQAWAAGVPVDTLQEIEERQRRIVASFEGVNAAIDRWGEMAKAAQRLKADREAIEATSKELSLAVQEQEALLSGMEICPLCGSPMDATAAHGMHQNGHHQDSGAQHVE
ncbi:AAA family ATPase [Acidithiobacillus acidisediminis]|uniref:AAA family ATPase n=1 Tax=Acidithiobacillus acidisediminis TaxID=2937799 RepID=UPI00200DD534|nr:AAA family ATPase [Acidithiobacillus sp. S30A2]